MMESNAQEGLGRYLRAGFHRVVYALWDYSDQLDELRKIENKEEAQKKLNDMADRFAEKYRGGDPVWSKYLKLNGKYTLPNITGLSAEELVVYRELDIQLFVKNSARRRDLNRAQIKLRWKKEKETLKKMEDEKAAEKKLDALVKEIGPVYEGLEKDWTDYVRLDGQHTLNKALPDKKAIQRIELQMRLYGSNKSRRVSLAKLRWKVEKKVIGQIKDEHAAKKKLKAVAEELGPKYPGKEDKWTEYIRLDGRCEVDELLPVELLIRRRTLKIELYGDCDHCEQILQELRLKKRWKDEKEALKKMEDKNAAIEKAEALVEEIGPKYPEKAEAWTEYLRLDSQYHLKIDMPIEQAFRRQELLIDLYGSSKGRREKLERLQRQTENLSEVSNKDEFRFSAAVKGGEKKEYVLSEGTHFLEEIGLNVEIAKKDGSLTVKFSGNNKEDLPIDIEFAGSDGRQTKICVKTSVSDELNG